MRTYSYDPILAVEYGMDRMRLELGDTTFNPGELTAALCDEEYLAILADNPKTPRSWKKAKIRCLKAILMKYSHQTTMSVSGLSYNFSDRVRVWREMLEEEEKKSSCAVPSISSKGLSDAAGGTYFYTDMHANPGKW